MKQEQMKVTIRKIAIKRELVVEVGVVELVEALSMPKVRMTPTRMRHHLNGDLLGLTAAVLLVGEG